jgi:MFS family permease
MAFMHQWGTKYLVHDHHLTQLQAGRLLWLPPLAFDVGAIVFGHLASVARTRGSDGVPRPLLAVAAIGMVASAAIPFAATPELAVAAMCVMAAGGGGMYALPMADMAARIPPAMVATAGGLGAGSQSVAQIAANLAIGASVTRTGSYLVILVALGLWVLPGAAAWLLIRPPPLHPDAR